VWRRRPDFPLPRAAACGRPSLPFNLLSPQKLREHSLRPDPIKVNIQLGKTQDVIACRQSTPSRWRQTSTCCHQRRSSNSVLNMKRSTTDLLCPVPIAHSDRCTHGDYQRSPTLPGDGASIPERRHTAYTQTHDTLLPLPLRGCENGLASLNSPSLGATATVEWGCIGRMGWKGCVSRLAWNRKNERRFHHQSPALPSSDWKPRRSKETTRTMKGMSKKEPSRERCRLSKEETVSFPSNTLLV
jgi:hypothetical protein